LGEPVAELIGASVDPRLGHPEAQDDFPVQLLDMKQVDVAFVVLLFCTRSATL
jgi:hypothetical protein